MSHLAQTTQEKAQKNNIEPNFLDISTLSKTAQAQLLDFYDYLKSNSLKPSSSDVLADVPNQPQSEPTMTLEEIFADINANNVMLPKGYKFNREEVQRYYQPE